jgi:hypothetical protein
VISYILQPSKKGVAQLDDMVGAIPPWLPQNPRAWGLGGYWDTGGYWGTAPTTGSLHECATRKKKVLVYGTFFYASVKQQIQESSPLSLTIDQGLSKLTQNKYFKKSLNYVEQN